MYETYDHLAFKDLMNDACGVPTTKMVNRWNIIIP